MFNTKNMNRVNKVDSCYIPHAAIKRAIDGIEHCILLSEGSKEPINVTLTGLSGTGKSTTCKAVISKRKKEIKIKDSCEVTIIPAFYCEIPSPVTIKGVASAMLQALHDPAPTKGTALDLTYRLGKLLELCETKVILLDELQHLLLRDIRNKNNNVKDWLKSIINQFKVPIVIVGLPECIEVINTDSQLARRFTNQFKLNNLKLGNEGNCEFRMYIKGLATSFMTIVKLDSFPDFNSDHISLTIYAATGGNPSDISELFKRATLNALDNDKNTVGIRDFEFADQSLVLPNSLEIKNLFELSYKDLTSALFNPANKRRKQ